MGDHTEAIQIDFDPSRISYEQLLELFWNNHNPTEGAWSRQYMAAVWCHDARQRTVAEHTRDALARSLGREIRTPVLAAGTFTRAEDYHQKYQLRAREAVMTELRALYPTETAFTDSTLAARLNAVFGGDLDRAGLLRELDALGLPDARKQALLAAVGR